MRKIPTYPISLIGASILQTAGKVGGLVGTICDYRIQIKEIDAQILANKEQARIIHHKIDAVTKIKLRELENQKLKCKELLNIAKEELLGNRIERAKLIEIQNKFIAILSDKNATVAEKKDAITVIEIYKELISESMKNSREEFTNIFSELEENNLKIGVRYGFLE